MRLGYRGRLFFVSLLVISGVGVASGAYLEVGLRGWMERRLEQNLLHHAHTIREAIGLTGATATAEAMDPIADRLGHAADIRVTIIDADGLVLGDSGVVLEEIGNLDPHGQRPEVLAAKQHGKGVARRYSNTVNIDLLYVAIQNGDGVIRVSMPLSQIDTIIGRLRFFIIVAGLLGLLFATAMSFLASHLMSRTLRRMVHHARALVRGEGLRLDVDSSDEIGRLAGSINRMADELEGTLATLASERGRFETVLESMSEAILALDPDDRVQLMNSAAKKLIGLRPDARGRILSEVTSYEALEGLAQDGRARPASLEFTLNPEAKSKDEMRFVLARARPLTSTGGTVIVMLDVTDIRRLERIRKDFVANVSHELRTPVSVIRANAETLLDGGLEDPKRARSFVEAMHRNSERLSRIIADLLELSRIEAGRYPLDFRPVAIRSAATRAVELLRDEAARRRIELTLEEGDSADVNADPKALGQVLNNLLENAVKYTDDGGHVRLRIETDKARVKVFVEDDGVGVPEKYRGRIFERFYRVDKGRSRETGGTGLGLAIVKHFVESMQGAVGVEAGRPRGSIFWFELPRSRQASLPL